jgi:hypothetical protein
MNERLNRKELKERREESFDSLRTLCSLWLIILFVFATVPALAQIQQAWVAKYNNGIPSGNHQALKMTVDASGNIYVLGVSANADTNTGYVVGKYAPNGNEIWAARYDSTNYPSATPTGFAVDSSNNVVVTGNSVTVKYDVNGKQLWSAPYNGTAIAVDAAQNSYVTGVSSTFTTLKLSSAASNLWTKTWTYAGYANLSQGIAIDSSTNVYVTGSETYFNSGGVTELHLGTLKYDLNGNLLWSESAGSAFGSVQVVGLVLSTSGNAYIEGNSGGLGGFYTYQYENDGTGGVFARDPSLSPADTARGLALDNLGNVLVTGGGNHNYGAFQYETFKLDTNGNYLWTNFYPSVVTGNSIATSIVVDQGNNAYVTGYSPSLGTNSTSDIVTLKYDSNGNQVWLQRYDRPGDGNDAANAIAVDNSGNVYVAGYETETNGYTSMILIKYSPVTLQKQPNGSVILHAYGFPGESFDLQASTNLQTWEDLGDVIADTNGLVQFDDTNAPLFNCRFYYTVPQ